MKVFYTLSIIFIFSFCYSQNVTEDWINRFSSLGDFMDFARDMDIDSKGNIYVTGISKFDYIDWKSGDYTTVKYSPDGDEKWIKVYDNGSYDEARVIKCDKNGSLFVAGESYNNSNSEMAIIKYDTAGTVLWIKRFNGITNAMTVDDSGNVYIAGISDQDYLTIKYSPEGIERWIKSYNGQGSSFDEAIAIAIDDSGNVIVSGTSADDFLTIKYSSSGIEKWTTRYNGPGNGRDQVEAMIVDEFGNIYTTGFSDQNTPSNPNNNDFATIKYSPAGNQLWVKRYNGSANSLDRASDIALYKDGNIIVTGYSAQQNNESDRNYDFITIKYDINSNIIWEKQYSGPGGSNDYPTCITVDEDTGIYIAGCSYQTKDFKSADYVTIKYDDSGNQIWIKNYNGPGNNYDCPEAILVDNDKNVYVTGWSPTDNDYPTNDDFATIKYVQDDRFRANRDGWSFANEESSMWPEAWWRQFNYDTFPTNISKTYEPADFPDWQLFVEVFGEDQCYISTNLPPIIKVPRPSAIYIWRKLVKKNKGTDNGTITHWGGSCIGFALSSLLYYNDYLTLSSTFPDAKNVYGVRLLNESRKLVNKWQLYQYDIERLRYINNNKNKTALETLNEINKMLEVDNKNNRFLCLSYRRGSGWHTVVISKIEESQTNPDNFEVWVYDPNHPSNEYIVRFYGFPLGTWEYDQFPGYEGGINGIYLSEPIENYLSRPKLILNSTNKKISKSNDIIDYITVFCSNFCDISISNLYGSKIGFRNTDSTLFNEIESAFPILSYSDNSYPPFGYYLPDDTYSIQITNNLENSLNFIVIKDSILYSYTRENSVYQESDNVHFNTELNQLNSVNMQSSDKKISISSISIEENAEKLFELNSLQLAKSDSVSVQIIDKNILEINNKGLSKTYDLYIENIDTLRHSIFKHSDVMFSGNSAHLISPNWKSLDTSIVPIYVDEDFDGIFDDTLTLFNQATKLRNNITRKTQPNKIFLYQNYPNPFNSSTVINIFTPIPQVLKIRIFNICGELVDVLADEKFNAGYNNIEFTPINYSSGIYFYTLESSSYKVVRKMLLIK